jgi:hypothetical protein
MQRGRPQHDFCLHQRLEFSLLFRSQGRRLVVASRSPASHQLFKTPTLLGSEKLIREKVSNDHESLLFGIGQLSCETIERLAGSLTNGMSLSADGQITSFSRAGCSRQDRNGGHLLLALTT